MQALTYSIILRAVSRANHQQHVFSFHEIESSEQPMLMNSEWPFQHKQLCYAHQTHTVQPSCPWPLNVPDPRAHVDLIPRIYQSRLTPGSSLTLQRWKMRLAQEPANDHLDGSSPSAPTFKDTLHLFNLNSQAR